MNLSTMFHRVFNFVNCLGKNVFFLLIISNGGYGLCQQKYDFYIVEKPEYSLSPVSKEIDSNGLITLTFSNSALTDFFESEIIYKYEKAFPSVPTGSFLSRVYEISISDQDLILNISSFEEVELCEEIPIEFPAYTPNDPFFPISVPLKNQLSLIRATKAWDINKGNPDVIVAVVDDNFNISHEDLINKIVYHTEANNTENHGTKVAGMVAAETDNGKGISAVGFNINLYAIKPYI